MLITRTPVRISLAGGGTDFPSYYEEYGGLVLSTSIDKYFYTVLTEREDHQTQIISSDLKALDTCEQIEKMQFQGSDLEIPFAVLKYLRRDVGVNLFLASEVPPGTGLGSSAAVCVNILKTLSVHLGQDLSERDLAETAFHIARDILRRPVGKQDEYAVALGGLNLFRFHAQGVDVEPLRLPEELLIDLEQNLMLFFTGSSRDSSEILQGQDKSVQHHDDTVLESLTKIKGLVLPMRDSLLRADLDAFAALLDESWMIKKTISTKISNARLDDIYQVAKRCGALGGKITGAGGGGFLLLYCERKNQAKVRDGLRQFGLKELTFHLDSGGARVVYDNPFFDSDSRRGMRWTFTPNLEAIPGR
jgi:D-glycero-alpha-D-manno-heptose-7-phosphate kinase